MLNDKAMMDFDVGTHLKLIIKDLRNYSNGNSVG